MFLGASRWPPQIVIRSSAEAPVTQDALAKQVGELAISVVADSRWRQDDLSVSILGMLLYGYALAIGRMVMFLDPEDIDAAVLRCMTGNVGAAAKWSSGLVADASASAFDKAHHPGHHELIGVGHSYFGVKDRAMVVDNVFTNIAAFRKRAASA
jgi:hypothetical protein